MARETKPKPAELVECHTTYATDGGSWKAGTLLRADHPVVRAHPQRWAPAGKAVDEIARLRAESTPEPPPSEPLRFQGPPSFPDDEAVICRETFLVVATGQTVTKGQRFHRDDPVVRLAPQHFTTAPVPLTSARR